jgi:hypothetical protein
MTLQLDLSIEDSILLRYDTASPWRRECCSSEHQELINPLTLELNPSSQRCLMKFFTGDFASWTAISLIYVYVKNQQIQQLFIQFINYVR